jgi:nicotinamidase-related amidase
MKTTTDKNEFESLDPLQETYRETIANVPERMAAIRKQHAALLCIDMQYLDAAPGYGVFADAASSGVPPEAQKYYFGSLEDYVLPNVRRLQDCFRANGLEVIHTRIQSLTQDGRDRSPGHKRLGLHAAPGSKEAEFLMEIAPRGDELVINKTASGVFTSTNLEFVLRNMGIDALFVTGVYTNECVSTTVRDASDLGFLATVIEDACTTVTRELQDFTIAVLKDRYARILSTDSALHEINSQLGHKNDARIAN